MNNTSTSNFSPRNGEIMVPSIVSTANSSSRSCFSDSLSSIEGNWMVRDDDSLISPFTSGRYLATGCTDGCAKFWDLNTGKLLRTITGRSACAGSVDLMSNGRYLLTGYYDNTAKMWDMESGKAIWLFREDSKPRWVSFVMLSSAGRYLALPSCSNGGDDTCAHDQDYDTMMTVKLWDMETGEVIRSFPWQQEEPEKQKGWLSDVISRHTHVAQNSLNEDDEDSSSDIESIALSFNDQYLAALCSETVKVWNVETGNEIQAIHVGELFPFHSIALSPYGEYLITRCSDDDRTSILWSVETGKKVRTFVGHTDTVCAVSVSLNGNYLATGSWDKTAKVWYLKLGEIKQTLIGHDDWVTSAALSPDGHYLVTGSNDRTAKLWNVRDGNAIRTFCGHAEGITSVAISSDDRFISGKWESCKKKKKDASKSKENNNSHTDLYKFFLDTAKIDPLMNSKEKLRELLEELLNSELELE